MRITNPAVKGDSPARGKTVWYLVYSLVSRSPNLFLSPFSGIMTSRSSHSCGVAFMNGPTTANESGASLWTCLALLASLVGVAGTIYLSLGLGLRACPLCFYQRVFIMGVAAVLAVGLL